LTNSLIHQIFICYSVPLRIYFFVANRIDVDHSLSIGTKIILTEYFWNDSLILLCQNRNLTQNNIPTCRSDKLATVFFTHKFIRKGFTTINYCIKKKSSITSLTLLLFIIMLCLIYSCYNFYYQLSF
jgi:hypothetical protein